MRRTLIFKSALALLIGVQASGSIVALAQDEYVVPVEEQKGSSVTTQDAPIANFNEEGTIAKGSSVTAEEPEEGPSELVVAKGSSVTTQDAPIAKFNENGIIAKGSGVTAEEPEEGPSELVVAKGSSVTTQDAPIAKFNENGIIAKGSGVTAEELEEGPSELSTSPKEDANKKDTEQRVVKSVGLATPSGKELPNTGEFSTALTTGGTMTALVSGVIAFFKRKK